MCTSPSEAFGHSGRVFGLAFHPLHGDRVIASASEDETVRVWRRSEHTSSWEQTSCCRGHTAEVLRVAWSPDGRTLASGSADHTVRLWQVGMQVEQSYSGLEFAALTGHPEEVYGLKYVSHPASLSGAGSDVTNSVSDMLITASGESLFLWDLHTGQMLHESAPTPVVTGMKNLHLSSTSKTGNGITAAASGSASTSAVQHGTAGAWAAGVAGSGGSTQHHRLQQQEQRAQQQRDQQEEEEDEEVEEDVPSYIFGLAQADGASWFAAACSDGMLRLWDVGQSRLQYVAAVKVHPSDMGSCCSFVPGQPWLVLSISKSGSLVLQDVRVLGHPLLMQDLEGPVYDLAWAVQAVHQPSVATAADDDNDAAAAVGGGSAVGELCMCVVGRDHCIRSYAFARDALLAAQLPEPAVQPMPGGYTGRLLAVASTADGTSTAAAGEAVAADTLKPVARVQQRRQLQPELQSWQPQLTPQQGPGSLQAAAIVAAAAAAPAVAATMPFSATSSRRARGKGSTGRQAVDLFGMEAEGEDGQELKSPPQQQQSQQQLTQQQQQQQQLLLHAAAEAVNATARPRQGHPGDDSTLSVAPTTAATVHSAAGVAIEPTTATEAAQAVPGCAAAAAGILLRAPLFTFKVSN